MTNIPIEIDLGGPTCRAFVRRRPLNLTATAAVLFTLVTTGAVAFQVALSLGAPWGSYAMAGKFPGRLPTPM